MEYYQITARERYLIVHHKSSGCSLRQIAKMLNRSASTISRELRRNVSQDGRYRPDKAESHARARRRRSRRGSQFEEVDIELVHSLVRRKWSPEQVSRRLRKLGRLDIGTATIYRMLAKDWAVAVPWTPTYGLRRRQCGPRPCTGRALTEVIDSLSLSRPAPAVRKRNWYGPSHMSSRVMGANLGARAPHRCRPIYRAPGIGAHNGFMRACSKAERPVNSLALCLAKPASASSNDFGSPSLGTRRVPI